MPNLDGARIYALLDREYVSPHDWVDTCRALLEGGADLIQVRAKNSTTRERQALIESVNSLVREWEIPLIVNDDLELAASLPCLGLHVGQDDVSPAEARQVMGPDRIIGLSTHSSAQVREAIALGKTLSYFAVGPVFATPTKPESSPVGLELVSEVANWNPTTPFFCIGGIKRNNVARVAAAGANRVAVVSDFLCSPNVAEAVREMAASLAGTLA